MSEKVSVIVPVYNVKDYLERCVVSICTQIYKNIEIILIDDGSTDKSSVICDELAKSDNRIQVVHKKNGGLSDARNTGIQIATGDLITFIDSDDWVTQNYISNLVKCMDQTNSDIAISRLQLTSKQKKQSTGIIEKYTAEDALIDMMYQRKIDTNASGKLFHISLFRNGQIKFPVGFIYEDLATIYKLFLNAHSVSIIDTFDYEYFDVREGSIVNTDFSKKNMVIELITEQMVKKLSGCSKDVKSACATRCVSACANVLFTIPRKSEFRVYRKDLKQDLVFFSKNAILNRKMRLKNFIFILFLKLYKGF